MLLNTIRRFDLLINKMIDRRNQTSVFCEDNTIEQLLQSSLHQLSFLSKPRSTRVNDAVKMYGNLNACLKELPKKEIELSKQYEQRLQEMSLTFSFLHSNLQLFELELKNRIRCQYEKYKEQLTLLEQKLTLEKVNVKKIVLDAKHACQNNNEEQYFQKLQTLLMANAAALHEARNSNYVLGTVEVDPKLHSKIKRLIKIINVPVLPESPIEQDSHTMENFYYDKDENEQIILGNSDDFVQELPPTQSELDMFNGKDVRVFLFKSPSQFYITSLCDHDGLQAKIDNICSNILTTNPVPARLRVGSQYFAYSQVFGWSRCFLMEVPKSVYDSNNLDLLSDSRVRVSLVDYMDEEEVLLNNLRDPLVDLFDFAQYPKRTKSGALWNVESTKDTGTKKWSRISMEVSQRFINNPLVAFVKSSKDEKLFVDLAQKRGGEVCRYNYSLIDSLTYLQAVKVRDSSLISKDEALHLFPKFTPKPILKKGEIFSFEISSYNNPNRFFICLSKDSAKIQLLYEKTSKYKSSSSCECFNYRQNVPCLVAGPKDKVRRGKIISETLIPGDFWKVSIFFVDEGISEEVSINQLRIIPNELLEVPPFAYLCKLYGVAPIDNNEQWGKNVREKLQELILNENNLLKTCQIMETNDRIVPIKMRISSQSPTRTNNLFDVGAELILLKYAKCTESEQMQVDQEPDNQIVFDFDPYEFMKELQTDAGQVQVRVSQITSPGEFHVQLVCKELQEYFDAFLIALNVVCKDNTSSIHQFTSSYEQKSFSKKERCFFCKPTKYGLSWSRGIIADIDNVNLLYQVTDIDIGSLHEVEKKHLLRCPPSNVFTMTGAFAFRCSLNRLSPSSGSSWYGSPTEHFKVLTQKFQDNLFMHVSTFDQQRPELLKVELTSHKLVADSKIGMAFFQYKNIGKMLSDEGYAFIDCSDIATKNSFSQKTFTQTLAPMCFNGITQWSKLKFFVQKPKANFQLNQQFLPPRFPLNFKFKGLVTHVDKELNIYCQIFEPQVEPPIKALDREILIEIKKVKKFDVIPYFLKGLLCTAYSKERNKWCRAVMVDVDKTKDIIVDLVDYGNQETIPIHQITSQIFGLSVPKLATSFPLVDAIPYTPQDALRTLEEMRRLLLNNECQFEIVEYEPLAVSVTLPHDQGDLFAKLFAKDLVSRSSKHFVRDSFHNFILDCFRHRSTFGQSSTAFRYNQFYSIAISSTSHRNYFWFQANKFANPINEEQKSINDTIDTYMIGKHMFGRFCKSLTKDEVKQFQSCYALYQDAWYRAMVLQIVEDEKSSTTVFEVLFVDYGNVSVCTQEQIRQIQQKEENLPVLCSLCQLFNVRPKNMDWSKVNELITEEISKFDNLLAIFKTHEMPFQLDIYSSDPLNPLIPRSHALQHLVNKNIIEFCHPEFVKDVLSQDQVDLNSNEIARNTIFR